MTDIADILKLNVTPHDNLSYRVQSSTGKKEYLVDLLENGGVGRCSCINFEMKVQPILNGQDPDETFRPYCKHIIRCRLWLAQGMISQLVKQKLV